MKKYKVLLLGYSDLAKNKLIKTFINNNIQFSVASKSEKKNISGAYEQFQSYEEGLKHSLADIVYISLPNSFHYKWAKKALNYGYHVVIDKPICENLGRVKSLIKIAKKNNKLLSEAIFFNYHKQISSVLKISGGIKNINYINTNFVIPKLQKNNIRSSKKLKGGVLMDMGCYASSIADIFCSKKIISKKIIIKKDNTGLDISFNFIFDYSSQIYSGQFKFGGEYQNDLTIYTDKKIIKLKRVFSPPTHIDMKITVEEKNHSKTYIVKKEDAFENYFKEVTHIISIKKYDYYFKKMIKINKFIDLLKN